MCLLTVTIKVFILNALSQILTKTTQETNKPREHTMTVNSLKILRLTQDTEQQDTL